MKMGGGTGHGAVWAKRMMLALIAPVLVVGCLEGALRVAGWGYPSAFLVPERQADGTVLLRANQRFGWRFFPRAIARAPLDLALQIPKPPGVRRVFVLGESAALGDPAGPFSFTRMLDVMMRARCPGERVEFVNVAMTAINSHVVREIARACAGAEPDLFIVYMGNNEILGPYGPGTTFRGFSGSLRYIRANMFYRSTRVGQLLDTAVQAAGGGARGMPEWEGLSMFSQTMVAHDDPALETAVSHFEANLRDILDAAGGAGAATLVCTVAVNLRACPPFASQHRRGLGAAELAAWEKAVADAMNREAAGDDEGALEAYDKAYVLDGEHAELRYRRARCLERLGRDAMPEYEAARDLDALRFRTDTRLNDAILKAVDLSRPRLALLELVDDPTLQEDGVFVDHVHFSFEGNYRVAARLFEGVCLLLGVRGEGELPGADDCRKQLAFSAADEAKMYSEICERAKRPPFTGQAFNEEAVRAWQTKARAARPAGGEEVRELYERAMAARPDDWMMRQNYARLLMDAGDGAAAVPVLQAAVGIAPWGRDLKLQLAEAQARAGEREAAFQTLENSAPRRGLDGDFVRVGARLAGLRAIPASVPFFERALELNPRNVDALANLAGSFTSMRRYDDALAVLERALKQDPRDVHALYNRAMLALAVGAMDDARDGLEAVLRELPRFARAKEKLADILVRRGKNREAAELYSGVLGLQPYQRSALVALAWLRATSRDDAVRDGAVALALADRAAWLSDGQDPLVLTVQAAAHAEAGDFEAAVKLVDEARKIMGDAVTGPLAEMRKNYAASKPWRDAEPAGTIIPGSREPQAEPLVR